MLELMEGEVILPKAVPVSRRWSRNQKELHYDFNKTCKRCLPFKDKRKALQALARLDCETPDHGVTLAPCPHWGWWHLIPPAPPMPEPEDVLAWAIKQGIARKKLEQGIKHCIEKYERRRLVAVAA